MSARASCKRMRQPPEKLLTGRSNSCTWKPSPKIRVWARAWASWAPASCRVAWAWAMAMPSPLASAAVNSAWASCKRVSPASTKAVALSLVSGICWETCAMRQVGGMDSEPPSSCKLPLSKPNKLDLPAPLRPTKPTRSPGLMVTLAWSNNTLVPRCRVSWSTIIMA